MKKIIAVLVIFLLCLNLNVFAENMTIEEVNSLLVSAVIENLGNFSDDDLETIAAAVLEEHERREAGGVSSSGQTSFEPLSRGSKGDSVMKLQQRLVDLKYLSGKVDGDFGGGTESAVKAFQKAANIEVTGIVNKETWTRLFSNNAPAVKTKTYKDFSFKEISRDPDAYKGISYKFSGKIVQLMESKIDDAYTQVDLRIATKGKYDNVVYVKYRRPAGEARVLEGDKVTVDGTCGGLYSYTSLLGGEISLPLFNADSITIKK